MRETLNVHDRADRRRNYTQEEKNQGTWHFWENHREAPHSIRILPGPEHHKYSDTSAPGYPMYLLHDKDGWGRRHPLELNIAYLPLIGTSSIVDHEHPMHIYMPPIENPELYADEKYQEVWDKLGLQRQLFHYCRADELEGILGYDLNADDSDPNRGLCPGKGNSQ